MKVMKLENVYKLRLYTLRALSHICKKKEVKGLRGSVNSNPRRRPGFGLAEGL